MSPDTQAGHTVQMRLKASLLGMAGSFILFVAYLAIPPLGIFAGMLAPFPIAYTRVRFGRLPSLIVLFGSAIVITVLFGPFAGSLYFAMCGMTGFLMPELLLFGTSIKLTLFCTVTANVLFIAAGIFVYGSFTGVDIHQLVSKELSDSMQHAIALYEKAGVKGEELDLLKRSINATSALLKQLYPALTVTVMLAISGLNLLMLRKSTAQYETGITYGDFSTFKNPDQLVWVFIASGFAMFLPVAYIDNPVINVMFVVVLLYFIQGMAVITTLFNRTSITTLVRVILYAMLIIQPYLAAIIAGVGLFDLWIDFRTPKTQENL